MSQPIAILGRFLTQPVTGVQRVAREVLEELDAMAARGEIATPRLLVPVTGDLIDMPDLKAIQVERIGHRTGHAWEQLDLSAHVGDAPLLCLGNTAPLSRLYRRDRPVVVMVHDLSYKYFPSAYSRAFRAFYSALIPQILYRADRVVTVSAAERDMIAKHYPRLDGDPRFTFLQNGGVKDDVLKAALAEQPRPASERPYGLYVGSLTKRKNAEGVLRTAMAFLQKYPDMTFRLAGANAGSFTAVDLEIPAELSDRLEFLGQIDSAERIYDLYRSARFLLFPSFYEASPLPPIEAMTFGCPVVCSDIPSLAERCGDAALYCDPDDPASILAPVVSLMEDPDIWSDYAARARAHVQRYSWYEQAKSLVALCEAVR